MTRYLVPTANELGELVRGYRKQLGWTQARLALQAGLFPKTVSALEAGSGKVLLVNVMRCLSALDVDLYLASRPRAQTSQVTEARETSLSKAKPVSTESAKGKAPHARNEKVAKTIQATPESAGIEDARDTKAGARIAGASKAGASKSGANQSGVSKAGAEKAGATKPRIEKTSRPRTTLPNTKALKEKW